MYNVLITGDAIGLYYDRRLIPVAVPMFDGDKAKESLKRLLIENAGKIMVTHFGVCDEPANKVINKAIAKIIEWEDIISNLLKSGIYSADEVYRKMLEVDEDLKYIVTIRENNPLSKGSGYNCVLGMIYYVAEKLGIRVK